MEHANPLVSRRQIMLAGSLAASAAAAASFDPAHKPAIGNLEFTMELNKPLCLPGPWDRNLRGRVREPSDPVLATRRDCGVVGKLVVGEDSPWNHVGSHLKPSII